MKTVLGILFVFITLQQMPAQVPMFSGAQLRDLDGRMVSLKDAVRDGQPLLLVFWKSGNSTCCENLETIQSAWLTSLRAKGVTFIAICEDCSGSWSHVKPIVKAHDWEFDVFIDVNGDLRRELGVTAIPSTLLFGKDMELLCRHPGWCSGNDELLCKKILGHLESMNSGVKVK